MDINVTCIVAAADVTAARALAVSYGDGPNTFSVPLSTSPTETVPANATHYGMSGYIPEDEVLAFQASVDPMINVTSNENTSFQEIIANRTPTLYLVQEPV